LEPFIGTMVTLEEKSFLNEAIVVEVANES
jgi:hypothetical protein